MYRFECDYTEGACEEIIQALVDTNMEQTAGYGMDMHCDNARTYIKKECKNQDVDVHFLVGGTQTNTTVIASILRPHQGVIAADTGHIGVHETGAIEATGHKVLTVTGIDGKLKATDIRDVYDTHFADGNHEHMVQPGMVYLSQPTEVGTIYSKKELEDISNVCRECHLPLFVDGARLGYALEAPGNDVTIEDLAQLTDVFYIGGTKVGALFGEAVVIVNDNLKKDFRYFIKQRGGMLAKGRLLGIQFETLFADGLYYRISKHAINLAMQIKEAFEKKGYSFFVDSCTNQQFPIISKEVYDKLAVKYAFSFWERVDDDRVAVRFCTSWATTQESVEALINDINNI